MHRDFDAALRTYTQHTAEADPVEFTLAGERFRTLLEPTLGDLLDLHRCPEPPDVWDLDNPAHMAIFDILDRFVRRGLPDDGTRERWEAALYRIPRSGWPVIYDVAQLITEQLTGFPSEPPASSSAGRRPNGRHSSKRTGGKPRSRR